MRQGLAGVERKGTQRVRIPGAREGILSNGNSALGTKY